MLRAFNPRSPLWNNSFSSAVRHPVAARCMVVCMRGAVVGGCSLGIRVWVVGASSGCQEGQARLTPTPADFEGLRRRPSAHIAVCACFVRAPSSEARPTCARSASHAFFVFCACRRRCVAHAVVRPSLARSCGGLHLHPPGVAQVPRLVCTDRGMVLFAGLLWLVRW